MKYIYSTVKTRKTIEFEYRRLEDRYVPIIEVKLLHNGKYTKTLAYVDSGATTSIFHTDIAKSLGINYKKGEKRYPMGVSGHILTYLNKIEMEIADIGMNCNVLFSDEFIPRFNLLGREDIFNHFKVCFDDRERTLTFIKK